MLGRRSRTDVPSQLSGILVIYASRTSANRQYASRTLKLAPFVNAFAIIAPVIGIAAHLSLQVLAAAELDSIYNPLNTSIAALKTFATEWQEGSAVGVVIQPLLKLAPVVKDVPDHIHAFQIYTLWWAIVMLLWLALNIIVILPSGLYQIHDLRRQLRQLRSARSYQRGSIHSDMKPNAVQRFKAAVLVRYNSQQLVSKSSSTAPSVDESHLLLLERVCVNVAFATAFFCFGCLSLLPLSLYAMVVLSTGGVSNLAVLVKLEVIAV
jgi:hypothetical protein